MKVFAFAIALCCVTPLSAQPRPMFQLHPPPQSPYPLSLNDTQKSRLNQALVSHHEKYDPDEAMLKRPFSSPGYHTTLKGGMVHPTREAANYAVALLDTGDAELQKRAEAVLRKIVSLQDTNPENKTYGIWSWFLEEPLSQMAPPDWNWADFIGTQLLQIALSHCERLPADLMAQIDAAIGHACRAIIKRNVGPGYTNIAIMGTYVTLVAGELYNNDEFRDYGLRRLKNFHEFTLKHGAFSEYNSPTYTIVALEEIGRLRAHVRTPEAKPLIEDIYRVAWQEIADHFHAPTQQWAGPHSRAYRTLLPQSLLAHIERSTEGRVNFGVPASPSLHEHRLPLPAPRDLEPFFTTLDKPRELAKTFVRDEPRIIGTTYLAPQFALGTINRGDLWNQRRSLLAYWGDAKAPSYLHLRFLHDGYDFSAAQFFSAQSGGAALAAINFATDGGDTHVSLDRIKNATFKAKDLRLRFELGGEAGKKAPLAPHDSSSGTTLQFADKSIGLLNINLLVPFARFGDLSAKWEVGQDKDRAWLDKVLYSGEERTFNLSEINEAALGVGVALFQGKSIHSIKAQALDGRLYLKQANLAIDIPMRPAKVGELQKDFKTSATEPFLKMAKTP
jgi:hypothetical protein